MNSLRNVPVLLLAERDGTYLASCPLMPECRCRSATRAGALDTMYKMLRSAVARRELPANTYEMVYLAIAPSTDSLPAARPSSPPGDPRNHGQPRDGATASKS